MLAIPPRARQAPEVRQVFQLYPRARQHSSFGTSLCKRTPCVRVAVVCIELEAFAAIEDVGEFGPQLARGLEERRWFSGICEDGEGVREMAFVYPYSQFGWKSEKARRFPGPHHAATCGCVRPTRVPLLTPLCGFSSGSKLSARKSSIPGW